MATTHKGPLAINRHSINKSELSRVSIRPRRTESTKIEPDTVGRAHFCAFCGARASSGKFEKENNSDFHHRVQ